MSYSDGKRLRVQAVWDDIANDKILALRDELSSSNSVLERRPGMGLRETEPRVVAGLSYCVHCKCPWWTDNHDCAQLKLF